MLSSFDWPYAVIAEVIFLLIAIVVLRPKFDFFIDVGFISLRICSGYDTNNDKSASDCRRDNTPGSIPSPSIKSKETEKSQMPKRDIGVIWYNSSSEVPADGVERDHSGSLESSKCGSSYDVVEREIGGDSAVGSDKENDTSGSNHDLASPAASTVCSSISQSSLCKKLTRIAEETELPLSNSNTSSSASTSTSQTPASDPNCSNPWLSGCPSSAPIKGIRCSFSSVDDDVMNSPDKLIVGKSNDARDNNANSIANQLLPARSNSNSTIAAIRAATSEFQPGTGWLRPYRASPTISSLTTGNARGKKRPEEFMYKAISQLQCAFDAMEEDVCLVDKTAQEVEQEVTRLTTEVDKMRAELQGLKAAVAIVRSGRGH